MATSKNGPRSNFSLLPFEIQFRIIAMLQDGATFGAIAADPEIRTAYERRGMKLTPPAISRLKQSKQYREWSAQRLKEQASFTADRLATELLKENNSLDTIAEQTKVALLKALSDLSDLSDESRVKALRSVAQSVTAISSQAADRKIAALQKKLSEKEAQVQAAEAAWKAREAELLARIADLEKKIPGVDSGRVAAAMDAKFGV